MKILKEVCFYKKWRFIYENIRKLINYERKYTYELLTRKKPFVTIYCGFEKG